MIGTFIGGLESVFGWLLEASWQASVLAALVLSLQWALRGRLNPRWHHALWLLVVARLVLPILPESTLSLFQFTPSPPPIIAQTVTAPIFAAPPELPPLIRSVPALPTQYSVSALTILALIWLVGALGLLVLTWQVNRRFARHVTAAPRITDPRLLKLAETARNELGIHRSLRIIESAQVQSPAIMGLFRPTLILPTEVGTRFSDGELRFIFLHEFAHLKRGDLFLQWLVALLQIVHWFNPVLWYAFRRMRIDREPATDALVLSRTGEAQRESYGQVLVKLLEHYHTRHALPTLVGILEDKDQFKRRFSMIARFTRGAYGWSLLGVLLIGMLATLCLTERKVPAAETSKAKPEDSEVLLYVRFDKIGNTFGFGKLSLVASISDGTKIPGTGETLSVWCKSLTAKNAVLEFIATKPSGPPEKRPDGSSFQPVSERRSQQIVPLGQTFSFRIFDAVDVTTSPAMDQIDQRASPDLNAQMHAAVQKGDATAVQKLIDQGVDPNKVEDQGQPLIFAAGSPAVVEVLLQHGANPNARNSQNDAVLCFLLRNKGGQATAIARVLLEHGADPNIRSGGLGETPLMDARDGAAVDLLVQHGGDIHLKMTDGSGVLDMASDHPLDYFQTLLRHGVPFDVKKDGPTLLLRASWISNLPIMKEMIDRGVDPNVEGVWAMVNGKPDLMLPIRAAAVDNQPAAAKFLLAHGAKADDDMITALYNRDEKIVKLFWESGVRNISELCYQISQGAPISDLGKLLATGVPADPPQDKKITPLGEAAQLGNMEAVKLLIAHKADVNASGQPDPKAPKGWEMTPLCLAAAEGQDEVVAYLLQHGATPDPAAVYQAGFNSYPYSEQRSKDHFEKTVRILIDAGALKNIAPDMAGLVLAGPLGTRQGPPNPIVLKMILDAGINPESPMPYLAENGEKPNTVIDYYREYYKKRKDDPTYAQSAATIKPLLDMLEAADKSAKASTEIQTPTNRATAVNLTGAVTLQQAIDWDRDDFAKSLLDSGTKASQSDLIYALKASRPKIVSLIWNHGVHGCSPMSFAISQGASSTEVEAILNTGVKVEPDEDFELSPLCVACAFGNSPAAHTLLAHGANPNWIDKSREAISSPLWLAIGRRQPEIMQLLLDHGAVPQGQDVTVALGDLSADMKARAPAVYYQKASDCFRILVAHGALEKVPAYMKASVLWNACLQVQDMEVVKMLLAHGFRPTDDNGFGGTALDKVRDAVEGRNNWPASPQFKPFLDLLDAAAKNAPKSNIGP